MSAIAQQGILEGQPLSVGAFIKQRRVNKGLSQNKLAGLVPCSPSMIKQVEANKAMPSIEKANGICKALDIDPRDLFQELNEPGSVLASDAKTTGEVEPQDFTQKMITDLARSMGAKIEFPAAETDVSNENLSPVEVVLQEFNKVSDLVKMKGVSARLLPREIEQLEACLAELDLDDLAEVAVGHGLEMENCPLDDMADMSAEDRDDACNGAQSELAAAAVYGDLLYRMDQDELEGVADAIVDSWEDSEKRITGKGVFENPDDYLIRLRHDVSEFMLEAIKARKPYVPENNKVPGNVQEEPELEDDFL